MTDPVAQLGEFMRVMMEIDEIYDDHAAKSGYSSSAFWLMYAVRERELDDSAGPYTQRQFCRDWSFSPQTANSSLMKMREQGLVELMPVPGAKKEKGICFTEKGRAEADRLIAPLMDAERRSFSGIAAQDWKATMRALGLYRDLLRGELEGL